MKMSNEIVSMHAPTVSVMVAAWNEAANIESHIKSFREIEYPHGQLILCAGGDDGTYEIARRLAGADVLVMQQHPGEGKQRALARCLDHASSEVIYLADADCEFTREAFYALLEPLILGYSEVATGISEPLDGQRSNPLVQYQWFVDLAWASQTPEIVDGVLGRNCALTRRAIERIGGFSAEVATGTDYYMSRKLCELNIPIAFVSGSRIRSEYPTGARSYLDMWRRWNKNLLIHGLRFRAWQDVRPLVVSFLLAVAAGSGVLLAPIFGRVAPSVSGVVLGIAFTNRVRRVSLGARMADVRMSPRLIGATAMGTALDFVAVSLAVYDTLDRKRRRRW
jgi:glycosyltransferase involved in cell wall biosynthesis